MKKTNLVLLFVVLSLLLVACNLPLPDPVDFTLTPDPEAIIAGTQPTEDPSVPPANIDGAETIYIPGGSFWMGAEETDLVSQEDEKPLHQVTMSGFHIYTHEVTNEMYSRCVEEGACLPIQMYDNGPTQHYPDSEYADHPVVGVDWLMADDYCTWAGGRLPTEAEWEYASRGMESLLYPWGDEEASCDRVNMLGCYVPPDTVEIGSFADGNSPFEVWDMSGNVWEWVNDWYEDDYYSLSPLNNPVGPYFGKYKVVRGGGLFSEADKMRTPIRSGTNPHRPYDDVGFRCVPKGIRIPTDFREPPEIHEWGAPDPLEGGGERVEDLDGEPDEELEDEIPWYRSGSSIVSCPNPEGIMHVFLEIDSSEEVEYSVTVNGNAFTCTYDEMLRGLQCEGPIPDNNDDLDFYSINVAMSSGPIAHFYPDRPLDCEGSLPMWDGVARASCPDAAGFAEITFEYDPPVSWESVQLDGVDVVCSQESASRLVCSVPAHDPGDDYLFELSGIGPEGWPYIWFVPVVPASDCLEDMVAISISPFCFEGHQTVEVHYIPSTTNLTSVSNMGVPLACIGMAPGVQICGDLAGSPGTPTMISVCTEGEPCVDFPLSIPDCSLTGPVITYRVTPACYPSLGPVAVIDYLPADLPLVSAMANGFSLTCYDSSEPGLCMCSGIPGSPGAGMTVSFCLSDGTCFDGPITVPDCDSEDPAGFWNLLDVGCTSETNIYILIDTPFSDLTPGVSYDYSVSAGTTSYTCELHPTIHGRIYCHGLLYTGALPLEVCLSTATRPEICTSFEEFISRQPDCSPPEPEVTEEPGDHDEPPVDCHVYDGNEPGCEAHSDVCSWDPKGYCWPR